MKKINEIATGKKIKTGEKTTGISIKPISVEGTRKIADFAFNYAVKNNRKSVTSGLQGEHHEVHRRPVVRRDPAVAVAYGREVRAETTSPSACRPDPTLVGKVADTKGKLPYMERLIDNMCMQLVQKPEQYDVILDREPLRGHPERPVRRPRRRSSASPRAPTTATTRRSSKRPHGSAPKYKGQNKVNPTALILSAKLMLEHLGEAKAAEKLDRAVWRRHRRRQGRHLRHEGRAAPTRPPSGPAKWPKRSARRSSRARASPSCRGPQTARDRRISWLLLASWFVVDCIHFLREAI